MASSNTLVTPTKILARTMQVIHNESAFLGQINTQYNDEFGKKGEKAGSTVYPRRPVQLTVRSGAAINRQNVVETTEPIVVEPEFGIDWDFSDYDMTLSIDEFSDRYLQPAGKKLATELDMRIANRFYQRIYNFEGTPGTVPNTSLAFGKAAARLADLGAPDKDLVMAVNPTTMTYAADALKGLFNDQATVGKMIKSGLVKTHLGMDFQRSPNVPTHTVGVYGGTPLSNGATQGLTGAGNAWAATSAIITDAWTATTTVLNPGDIITFAGVNAVNPDNKQDLGYLKQFVVTAATVTDGSGNSTITVSPAVIAGGAYQNVTQRIPDNSAVLVLTGASGSVHPQNVLFHPDAFTMVTVPMDVPKGMDMAERLTYEGVSMRFVRGFDISSNLRICRFDIMAGFGSLQRDWACRLSA